VVKRPEPKTDHLLSRIAESMNPYLLNAQVLSLLLSVLSNSDELEQKAASAEGLLQSVLQHTPSANTYPLHSNTA